MTFSLATFLYYLKWRSKWQLKYLWLSLLFFIVALGFKEIAMTLPLIIILWEIYFYSLSKKSAKNPAWFLLDYFSWLVIDSLALDPNTIWLLWPKSFGWPWSAWAGNLAGFISDLFTWSYLRELFYKVWYHNLDSVVIILLAGLLAYFWHTFRRNKWPELIISVSVILILLPMMPLGLQRLNLGGERYLYLASAFFLLWLVIEINNLLKSQKLKKYFLLF